MAKTKNQYTDPNDTGMFDASDFEQNTVEQSGPVTVLGMTFDNDDERRAYFREQLRAKLPELRKIEGFPIGEDDDIINLSDPPYYTACPNPWLNDFIAEWEEDKKRLEAEGKRHAGVEVSEPYASDVSVGKNNPVYTAHTYHTKVPHPAIMRYILHYTQPGDIIFDGFAGTGMTGVAAAACGNHDLLNNSIENEWLQNFGQRPQWGARHAICGDLSPYATSIAYFYNTHIDICALEEEVKRIKSELEKEYGWMYSTTDSKGSPMGKISFAVWSDVMVCPNCSEEFVYWNQAMDLENQKVKDLFQCPHCGSLLTADKITNATESHFDYLLGEVITQKKEIPVLTIAKTSQEKIRRTTNDFDREILERISNFQSPFWTPCDRMPDGGETRRNDKYGITHIHHFFTKRNLIQLSILLAKIEDSPLRNQLLFLFTAMLISSSKMNRVRATNPFNRGKGHLSGTLYIPSLPTETSIIDQLSERLDDIKRALNVLSPNPQNSGYVGSADCLNIADNSIDYIFTDPPFGSNLSYSELNYLSEPWLRVITNNSSEAIENEKQNKNSQFYFDIMARCLAEYYRVLKPGKWMTVEFSNTSAAVWNIIQTVIQKAGFVIANVSALDKKQGSFKAVTTTTAVKQDLVISCYKPLDSFSLKFSDSFSEPTNVWYFVDEHLSHLPVHIERNNATTAVVERSPKILYDRLISFYVTKGYPVPMDASEFQKGLRERYIERDGMFFTPSQAAMYDEKKKTAPDFIPMGLIVSDEASGIEWLKLQLKDSPKTYQQIQPEWMQAINGVRKGDILPELMQILDENFIQQEDGSWRLPNIQDDVDKEALRTKALLREFKVYEEAARKPRGKIKEARVEALRAGFKQCYRDKDFATIVAVGDRIPQNLLTEDEQLLQFYEIASSRV